MVYREEGHGGGGSSAPRPQRIAKKVTIRRAPQVQPQRFVSAPPARVSRPAPQPAPQRQPVRRNPPRPQPQQSQRSPARAPFKSNSSGQVSGGGKAPRNVRGGNGGPQRNPAQNKPKSPPKAGQGKVQGAGAKPAPKAPGINQYLASDSGYQSGLSELMKTLQQFQTGNAQNQNDVRSAFQTAMERMGQEREQSLKSLQEDFASRGLLQSGLYAQSNSDYDTEYQNRIADLTKDQEGQLGALSTEASNFQGLNESQKAALKQAAIQRRADKYNIK